MTGPVNSDPNSFARLPVSLQIQDGADGIESGPMALFLGFALAGF